MERRDSVKESRGRSAEEREIICPVCMHHCRLRPGQTGSCRARANRGGGSSSLSYGRITSLALDPIEKKPLPCLNREAGYYRLEAMAVI